jgi:hypothetical protein
MDSQELIEMLLYFSKWLIIIALFIGAVTGAALLAFF